MSGMPASSPYASMYKEKCVSAEQAAAAVKSNDRIYYGVSYASPIDVDAALGERVAALELTGLEIVNELGQQDEPFAVYAKSTSPEQVRFSAPFFSAFDRTMQDGGRDWFLPMIYSELPDIWREKAPFDAAIIQVAPMDESGYFNLGPVLTDTYAALEASSLVIFEVNENMPRALGFDNAWPIGRVDYIVEGKNRPLPELPEIVPSETDQKIAAHVVSLIPSSSTLQLGIGGLPNAIGNLLVASDLGDFSCHSERLTEPYLDLFEAGKLTNTKNLNPGKITYSFAGGSKRLYDFVDNNPLCQIAPIDYITNFTNVSAIDRFMSINGCVNVDLYGQVCSESAGYRHISGTGGQLNFVMGACGSKGGKSFLCMHATRRAKDGSLSSNIRPVLLPGAVVSTPRSMVNYIVTEYGAVDLKGKTTRERAELLISIAHPDFRDALIREADQMGLLSRTSRTSY